MLLLALSVVAQVQLPLLASTPCAQYNAFLAANHFIYLLDCSFSPTPHHPPFLFSRDMSV